MKLEVAMMVGAESKAFLASMTNILERMEKLAGQAETKAPAAKKTKAAPVETAEESTDELENFGEEIEAAADEDEGDLGFDEMSEDEAPAPKATKAKKLTDKDVHSAALAHAKKFTRPVTLKLLAAKFKVKSIAEIKAEDYGKVIAALKV